MYHFKSTTKNVLILGADEETSHERAIVEWSAELEVRDWGIKDISLTINKLTIMWIDAKGCDQEIVVVGENNHLWDDKIPICPEMVTWNVQRNTFLVQF